MDLPETDNSDIVSTITRSKTPVKIRKFLAAYAAVGTVRQACAIAGLSRETHYHKLETDPVYQKAVAQAEKQSCDLIEDELFRRAIRGEPEPIFHQGEQVATILRKSDALLMFLARGAMPDRYRERVTAEVSGTINLVERMRSADQRLIAIERNAPATGTSSR